MLAVEKLTLRFEDTLISVTDFIIRKAEVDDLPAITRVRQSVRENLLLPHQLAARGITEASVAASLSNSAEGWVVEVGGEIVGFAIADREDRELFALFVTPAFEGRGIGSRLHDVAVAWLWGSGAQSILLSTGKGTEAAGFYERRGWFKVGVDPFGDIRYQRNRVSD